MDRQFVSRGGLKLQHALENFNVSPKGLVVLDVGSSTGGFVDCLLQNGAAKVFSLDTAYGELAWKLRQNPKVVVMERRNILSLENIEDLPELVDLVTIDVTFTPLSKILPVVKKFLKPDGKIIALLKPQYEDQKLALENHGVIPQNSFDGIVEKTIQQSQESGFRLIDKTESPISGRGGNREYLIYLSSLSKES